MKRKILLLTSILILFCTLFISAATLFSYIYSDRLDYGIDEQLFSSSIGDGITSYQAYGEIGELTEVWQDRSGGGGDWCEFEEISDYLKLGFISMEDRDFYTHKGVNLRRTVFALANHLFKIGSRFGASTITQQVIKNISGDKDFTLRRKINEIFRAYHLENRHSKDEIFELYLNIVPMPGDAYGVKEASKIFFNKLPSDLTLEEAALIVGVTNSPTRYNPYKNPEEAKAKRNRVLYAMLDNGAISKAEYDKAKNRDLSLSGNYSNKEISPWFVETARDELLSDLMKKHNITRSSALLLLRGAKVVLTMDIGVQKILDDYFENTNNLPDEVNSGLKYAMTVVDNTSGDIVGIVGNSGEKEGERLMNYARVKVTPGSVLKPLALYAPLLDKGEVNSATLFDDIPLYYNDTDKGLVGYPKNSPDVYDGYVTFSDAIAYSKNTVAATAYNMLGRLAVRDNLVNNYGFSLDSKDMYLAPLALGQLYSGVSLFELVRAYSAFPNNGVIRASRTYICVIGKDGKVLLDKQPSEARIMKKETAKIMTSLLEGVTDRGTARSINLKSSVATAGKTGTSGGNLDKLFIGYTPYYTAGIWCGYADGATQVVKLNPSHVKVWDEVMCAVHSLRMKDSILRSFDYSGLISARFNVLTGEYSESENDSIIGYFTSDNLPLGYKTDEYYTPVLREE